ncbi:MAG: nitroreductase family protein [Spirochaetota bacterium]|nr:MAG: nitroreductase family protein [Spirochaetota bacterium]
MVLKEIVNRYSVREYLDREVEDDKLKNILEAGRIAPSANNAQPWKFIVVKSPEKRQKIAERTTWGKFIANAPVLIVACKTQDSWMMGGWFDSAVLDIGIAVDHMTLQATHLGLGTCWVGDFNENLVKKLLNIPKDIRVVTLLTVGYPERDETPRKNRAPFSDVVSYEEY